MSKIELIKAERVDNKLINCLSDIGAGIGYPHHKGHLSTSLNHRRQRIGGTGLVGRMKVSKVNSVQRIHNRKTKRWINTTSGFTLLTGIEHFFNKNFSCDLRLTAHLRNWRIDRKANGQSWLGSNGVVTQVLIDFGLSIFL